MNISKHKNEIVVALCALFLSVLLNQYVVSRIRIEPATTAVKAQSAPSATPTPTVTYQPVHVDSPDGTMTLTMKQESVDTAAIYTFFATENSVGAEQLIATKNGFEFDSFSLPDNSWSPDNKYAFIKEQTATQSSYFVLASTDTLPYRDLQEIDIQALFSQKYPQYKLDEITGWAAPYLLILNTFEGEDRGPSFWFDISTKSFIRLGRQF